MKKQLSVKEGYVIKKQRVGFTIWRRVPGQPDMILMGGLSTDQEAEKWVKAAYLADLKMEERVGYYCCEEND